MAQAARPQTAEDIGRMQKEAMSRMREMQAGADHSAGNGWSTDPNIPRQNRAPRRAQPEPPPPRPSGGTSSPPPQEDPPPQNRQQQRRRQQGGPHGRGDRQPEQGQAPARNPDTTLLQDILGAVGLDDDRVLILGLILILVNSKADTTLILALCYLLL